MSNPKKPAREKPAEAQSSRQTDEPFEPASDSLTSSWSYEETVRAVEVIMTQIESGELDLADVFDQFAEAVASLRQCERFLSQRQQQMDLLIETLRDETE